MYVETPVSATSGLRSLSFLRQYLNCEVNELRTAFVLDYIVGLGITKSGFLSHQPFSAALNPLAFSMAWRFRLP